MLDGELLFKNRPQEKLERNLPLTGSGGSLKGPHREAKVGRGQREAGPGAHSFIRVCR